VGGGGGLIVGRRGGRGRGVMGRIVGLFGPIRGKEVGLPERVRDSYFSIYMNTHVCIYCIYLIFLTKIMGIQ
jgi:hypothetical protein